MNIPIYRAKKIDSDEYVEGYLYGDTINCSAGSEQAQDKYEVKEIEYYIMDSTQFHNDLIDPSTLAIHFPDMIDKNGKKIFASLGEDGVGGDMTKYINLRGTHDGVFKISQHFTLGVHIEFENDTYINICIGEWETFEVIGVHKGE